MQLGMFRRGLKDRVVFISDLVRGRVAVDHKRVSRGGWRDGLVGSWAVGRWDSELTRSGVTGP